MANEGNNESGWSTIIYVIVGIIVVGGFVGKSCSEKKEQPTQQINTQQISQQIKAQRLRDLINSRQQSNNTYPTQQRTNRITYSESYSTGIIVATHTTLALALLLWIMFLEMNTGRNGMIQIFKYM